ncbi:uncharacterized protein F4822DRAFT_169018 [Hypoxylon trugodes]|uniref:uncharacterized protein n=1 Tax=Hypoxylon trugodes TaxID=326681 RepID=UPI0021997E25|nr:uncharacterized protein F4822DRAFT_169018 [Hypoxylon trugodes]KAI1390993.1 hypothetical protein F4822DRAFT_169018 [Hypoxylon trugodes]
MASHNSPWGNNTPAADDYGLQIRPMGLKVQYTFDKGSQERCLARWPHTLHVQAIPLDEQNSIGVVDLKTCLQAVAQCSPELVGDSEKDYTVYAYDYSEPDTPLVGQGMLSWGLDQPCNPSDQAQLVTGRITKNVLAIFGKGARETLEVRLKLTAVARIARNNSQAPPPRANDEPTMSQRTSTPTPSESSEWNSFRQSNLNMNQPVGPPTNMVTAIPTPFQSFQPIQPLPPAHSNYQARNDVVRPNSQGPAPAFGSRPGSAGSSTREPQALMPTPPTGIPEMQQGMVTEELAVAPAPPKPAKTQSRPASRASSRPPSGRPRGRPRKKPLPAEGSTSGYEDGTDADDGPPRTKKRATTTKVQRSNTATFGSAAESLRVAASTSGSLRNFRPIAIAGEASASNPIQEIPRAPTPVPDQRMPGFPQARPMASSGLRRESLSGPGMDRSFTSSYLDPNRSGSYGPDARSPAESAGVSPSQMYSDEASPADIGSSPPVPRSARYSVRSSPAPSSPILPPMPSAAIQPDSGYMSGGIEDSRLEDDRISIIPVNPAPQAPIVAKPKPRKSRAKKAPPKVQTDLIIHTETPGPPELLPQTSIYNPPHLSRKNSEHARTPVVSEPPSQAPFREAPLERLESEVVEERQAEKAMTPEEATQGESVKLEMMSINDLGEDPSQEHTESQSLDDQLFAPPAEDLPNPDDAQPTVETTESRMEPPALPQPSQDLPTEPELPAVPASDPVFAQLTFPEPRSEPAHPQTDMIGPADGKSNKNFVKRQSIKQKLEEAISRGQLPSFCQNCGAIQTPTWRKIWKQIHAGVPEQYEFSGEAGHVTAINILKRDDEGNATSYEMIKKSLAANENKNEWTEILLCNPCGIWFSKFKGHRPAEKWEKDEQRLSQTRKKRANGSGPSRSKKARTKSDSQPNLTSEACLPTDPIEPPNGPTSLQDLITKAPNHEKNSTRGCEGADLEVICRGSTHSRGSGTPGSPITLDNDLGGTRRLLFPSPRKDGEQRILGEVAVNIVQTSSGFNAKGERPLDKENNPATNEELPTDYDMSDIFGTPLRPSTPPPKVHSSGPFKTPTRPTPSHRPITRSVTRSRRSVRSVVSPSHFLTMEQSPSRSPGSHVRRDLSNDLMPSHLFDGQVFDSPLSRSINELISEANNFVMPHSSSPHFEMDYNNLLPIDGNDIQPHDFGSLLNVSLFGSQTPGKNRYENNTNLGGDMSYQNDNQPTSGMNMLDWDVEQQDSH